MLEDVDRLALFWEMHKEIEESATKTVERLMLGKPESWYPPNHGFLPDEMAALEAMPRTPAMERALRKVIASAAASPVYHLFCLLDKAADPQQLEHIDERDRAAEGNMLHEPAMLHHCFIGTYWFWRRHRPDTGWRLDTHSCE